MINNQELFHRLLCEEEMFGDVVDRKQAFLDYKNINFTQPPNQMFPERLSMILVKIFKIFHFFFVKVAQERCLVIFQIENKLFQTIKISILPSRQIRCFLRGWSKILVKIFNNFFIFFPSKNSSGKMFGDILDRKQACLNHKNISFTQPPYWMLLRKIVLRDQCDFLEGSREFIVCLFQDLV